MAKPQQDDSKDVKSTGRHLTDADITWIREMGYIIPSRMDFGRAIDISESGNDFNNVEIGKLYLIIQACITSFPIPLDYLYDLDGLYEKHITNNK